MATSVTFLVVVVVALCLFAILIGVLVLVFRAASRPPGGEPGPSSPDATPSAINPPVLGQDQPRKSESAASPDSSSGLGD